MNFEFMKYGYPAIIIKMEDRATYYEALDLAHTTMNYEPFLQLVAQRVLESETLWLSVVVE